MKDYILARIAYQAYGDSVDWKNFQGNPMPQFEDLGEKIQKAWQATADVVGITVIEAISEAFQTGLAGSFKAAEEKLGVGR